MSNPNKRRWHLLPYDALEAVVEAMEEGADKHTEGDWEKQDFSHNRLFNAAMRHLTDDHRRENFDEESGQLHLARAAASTLMLLAHRIRRTGVDDRRPSSVSFALCEKCGKPVRNGGIFSDKGAWHMDCHSSLLRNSR